MDSPDFSTDRLAKYVVIALAIIALVIVAWIDINSTDVRVPDIVYYILGGTILGAENIIRVLKR